MSRINTNVAAIRAIGRLKFNHLDLQTRLERLSTGLRINRGKDDPAGLIASETLRSEIRAISQGISNSERAINVISTTEGALNEASALLLQLQALLVATANKGALTSEEIAANQLEIDSLLASIDRIANTASFGNRKLLDGSQAYTVSGVDSLDLASVALFSARVPEGGSRTVVVQVTQSAERAQLAISGVNAGGGTGSYTSASTIEIAGTIGTEVLSFASGTTLSAIVRAVNDQTAVTGVQARVSSVQYGGTVVSSLYLESTTFGSDAFVTVKPVSGNFINAQNVNATLNDEGVDAAVLINGQNASVRGLRADIRANGLDARVYLTETFGQILSSSQFEITGGGAVFQIGPRIAPAGQVTLGFNSISTSNLGNAVVGFLRTLASGNVNEASRDNLIAAQDIIGETINQIAVYRGRLGSVQKNQLETNINSLQVALENVTASESVIRDADIAAEVAALTRAQVLIQSTQVNLQISTQQPSQVLSLLG